MEIQPFFGCPQAGGCQRALMLPAGNRPVDQAGTLEDLHVSTDRWFADIKWGGEFANGRRALRESRQDVAAGTVGLDEK